MHEIGQMFVELNKEGGHGIRRIAEILMNQQELKCCGGSALQTIYGLTG